MSSVVSVYHNGPSSQIDKAGEWQLRWFHPTDTNSRVALVNIQGWEPPHLVISRDAGQSWKDRSIVNAKERANPDSDRPHTRSFGWSMKSPGSIYVGAGNSLYASTDYGQRWTSILPSLTSAVVAPPSGDVYAATALGVVKTRNDGRNWHLANLGLPNASAGDSNLFQAVQVQGQNIYVGARGGFWNSPDGGLTWNWISSDSALSNEIVSQLFVLRDDTKVFLQGNFTNDYGVIHVGRDSNILKLQPDGKLVKIRTGKSPSMIGMSPSDPATIYMAAGGSVLKSDDSGFSWETFDFTQGLRPAVASTPIVQVPLFAVASQSSKIVYVAVVLQKPFDAARNYALMQTLDGGATWRDVFPAKLMPTGFNYGALGDISGVAIDPRDSRTVYLAFNSGVYRSGDGGATWTQLPAKAGKINGITVSAQSSQVLYLATETGVWVSRNGGATWALGNVGPLQENVKTIVSGSELTLSQGSNGIYRLTSDLSWASSKWKECEEKPELGPISSTGPAVVISY
jgi:photosystem II stability/assembly factor-like uncharacterized protein